MAEILLDRILVATDFSSASTVALHYAVGIARHFGAYLYLAHVIRQDKYGLIPLNEREPLVEDLRARMEGQIAGVEAALGLIGPAHEVVVDHGDVWATLFAIEAKLKIKMTVIGTHGPRGVEKLLQGSMGEELLLRAHHPVFIVGPRCSIAQESEPGIKRVLYATDFSAESEPAMEFAGNLARELGAELYFLHVVEDVWEEPLSTGMEAAAFFRLRLLDKHWTIKEGLTPKLRVEFGQPAECILEIAGKLQITLIVLGGRGKRHPRVAAHLPGPTAYDVVSRSYCPVLVVPGQLPTER